MDAQDYFFSDLKADHKVKEDDLRKNFNSRLNRDQQETEKHALDLKKLHEKFMRCGELMAVQYNEYFIYDHKFICLKIIILSQILECESAEIWRSARHYICGNSYAEFWAGISIEDAR